MSDLLREVIDAARVSLRQGEHEGSCDSIGDDPCSLHIAAAKARHERLSQALDEYERDVAQRDIAALLEGVR